MTRFSMHQANTPATVYRFNSVNVQFGLGLSNSLVPSSKVIVLADWQVSHSALGEQLRYHWAKQVVQWIDLKQPVCSISQAELVCEQVWFALTKPDIGLLALGGGSIIDLAKIARYKFNELPRSLWASHWRSNTLPSKVVKHSLIAVPTTAGTGSEATPWATLWDEKRGKKLSWAPADGFAQEAWVDPLLTLGCPPEVTLHCALDALAHALESLWNQRCLDWIEPIAISAARSIIEYLPLVLQDPNNVEGREQLARASLMAGLCMSHTQTALAHALSYPLTANEGIAHGMACAVWLPAVWQLALLAPPPRLGDVERRLAQVFEGTAAEGAVALENWLHQLGVKARHFEMNTNNSFVNQALASPRGKNFILNTNLIVQT
jgi:alcohol dehydrogenase